MVLHKNYRLWSVTIAPFVQHLIDAGAPLDHINNLGWTALVEAVVLGDGGPDHIAGLHGQIANDCYWDIATIDSPHVFFAV